MNINYIHCKQEFKQFQGFLQDLKYVHRFRRILRYLKGIKCILKNCKIFNEFKKYFKCSQWISRGFENFKKCKNIWKILFITISERKSQFFQRIIEDVRIFNEFDQILKDFTGFLEIPNDFNEFLGIFRNFEDLRDFKEFNGS